MCFTDHLSLPVGSKNPAARKKGQPTRSLKHTHDMQAEILLVVPSHIHTHMRTLNLAHELHRPCSSLPLRLKWNHTGLWPPCTHLEVLPQKATVPPTLILIILRPVINPISLSPWLIHTCLCNSEVAKPNDKQTSAINYDLFLTVMACTLIMFATNSVLQRVATLFLAVHHSH